VDVRGALAAVITLAACGEPFIVQTTIGPLPVGTTEATANGGAIPVGRAAPSGAIVVVLERSYADGAIAAGDNEIITWQFFAGGRLVLVGQTTPAVCVRRCINGICAQADDMVSEQNFVTIDPGQTRFGLENEDFHRCCTATGSCVISSAGPLSSG
jgi:hypothetical protein